MLSFAVFIRSTHELNMKGHSARRIAAGLLLLGSLCVAQDEKPWQFPPELRSQMNTQLQAFMRAQVDGRWDDVARLLGRYRRGSSYIEYTPAHKNCLVETMKTFPMVAFDYQVKESPFSSEILSTPPNRRWWALVGEATFQTSTGLAKRGTVVVAYRNGHNWFFTPPPLDHVLSFRVTAEEIALDRKDEVEIRIPPAAPIGIVDLHVYIDPDDLKSRNVEFRLHNRTRKKIVAYSFMIDDKKQDGGISVGTGAERDAIMPESDSRVWKHSYGAFLYWCEGEGRMRITVEDVTFEDGTTWRAK